MRPATRPADDGWVRLLPVLLLVLLAGLLPAPALAHDDPAHTDAPHELDHVALAQAVQVARAQAGAQGDDGLPGRWCGTPTTTDRPGPGATRPQLKVVYAHAADQPDRFALWQDDLQMATSLVQRFLSSQTGGRKALRFDMGSSCGAGYVDLMTVRLGGPRDDYAGNFRAVVNEVWAKLGTPGGPRDLVVLADALAPGGGTYGEAELLINADEPGSGNPHNGGGLASVLWAPEGTEPTGDGWWPEGFLHEITHMLGGVTRTAPHSTPYGHCWDGVDLMCYEDGPGARATETVCAPDGRAIFQAYDCGRDDYFNPAPPAGSYLASHWNVYDNVFLAGCAELGRACGGSVPTLPPRPPVSTSSPEVLGTPEVGAVLAAASGTWINAPQRYGYRWQRDRAGDWEDVAGATEPTYPVTAADVGARLRVLVSAGNDDGEAIAESAPVGAVPAPAPFAPAPAPAAAPPLPPRPAAPAAPAQPRGARVARAPLRAGRRTLGWVRFALAAGAVSATPERLRLAPGRYAVRACVRPRSGAERCARRALRVRTRARVALPALRVTPGASGPLGATYRVTGRRLSATGAAGTLGP